MAFANRLLDVAAKIDTRRYGVYIEINGFPAEPLYQPIIDQIGGVLVVLATVRDEYFWHVKRVVANFSPREISNGISTQPTHHDSITRDQCRSQ